ncbi:uncharacterized protein [Apostichopus japonicus]|uniref:uncharacterized protein n=1 Tax=Stichopus japonicus TaxID=307972 RepID=UPI003AB4B35C
MEDRVKAMETLRQAAADTAMQNITTAQAWQKKNYDSRCNPEGFTVGSQVLMEVVKNHNRCGGKMAPRYTGPYLIHCEVKKGVYRLEKDDVIMKKTVNASRLKVYCKCESSETIETEPETNQPSGGKAAAGETEADKLESKPEAETAARETEDCVITGKSTNSTFKPSTRPKFRPLGKKQLVDVVKPRYWMRDTQINAAQALIRHQYPAVRRLQDTCLGENLQFEVQSQEFIQVHNANRNHWIVISTVGCKPGQVRVYDSLYRVLHTDTRSHSQPVTEPP